MRYRMTDLVERELERDAGRGDREARLQLGRVRIRAGGCPWCTKPREVPKPDQVEVQQCCCHD